jgi:hypothetical protein
MTPPLRKYLELERMMLLLDEEGDPTAETLREVMDPIWYSLTDEERHLLDDRAIGRIQSLEEIRVPAGRDVFGEVPVPAAGGTLPQGPIVGWKMAA